MIYIGIDVANDKHDCFITNLDGDLSWMQRLKKSKMK